MGWGRGREALLALMLSERFTPSKLRALVKSRSLESLGSSGAEALARDLGLEEDDLGAVREASARASRLSAELAAKGVGVVAMCEASYPALLREIAHPPPVLFLLGSLLETDRRALAIVGSRKPSLAGASLARGLARDLAGVGFTIVSGLARGIDTAAHEGALEGGGRTIAVLGSGVDVIYPPENTGLAARIAASGALVSEVSPCSPPLRTNFPRRNRLISGLAVGTIVVEAGEKSGALITAAYALDQNRSVFAVPGSPGYARSRGANRLLKEGARLVETAADVVEDVLPQLDGARAFGQLSMPIAESEAPAGLSSDEARVVALLSDAPVHVDEMSRHLKMETQALLGLLLTLETRGLARSLPGKFYVRGRFS